MNLRRRYEEIDGTRFPGKIYTEVELEPAYDAAKHVLLPPMMAVNKGHLVMLVEQGLISREDAAKIYEALCSLDLPGIEHSQYDPRFEDLFFTVENLLLQKAGDVAGNLHLARSRNDMGVAMYRMAIRPRLLAFIEAVQALKESLLFLAEEHADTVMLGYTHTQPAQPMTFGHYLTAAYDSLSRDERRLRAAYQNVNRSPMGAAAITTTGFPINRQRVAELLGFDEVIENSYDSIAGGDYLTETASAIELTSIHVGRFVHDLLEWATQEFSVLKVADPYVQKSSIMPQKRNPVAIEHSRSLLSATAATARIVITMLHNTPYGDIVDTEDDLQPYLWQALTLGTRVMKLLAAVTATMEVNKEVLKQRLKESFAVITELADTLVRECGLPFRQAHAVAHHVVQLAMKEGCKAFEITTEHLAAAAQAVLGKPLHLQKETLATALDPYHFVNIRKVYGGTAPEEVQRMVKERKQSFQQDQAWLTGARSKLEQAERELERRAASLKEGRH